LYFFWQKNNGTKTACKMLLKLTIGVPNFVGNTGNYAIDHVCPEECRPKDHKDWLLC